MGVNVVCGFENEKYSKLLLQKGLIITSRINAYPFFVLKGEYCYKSNNKLFLSYK